MQWMNKITRGVYPPLSGGSQPPNPQPPIPNPQPPTLDGDGPRIHALCLSQVGVLEREEIIKAARWLLRVQNTQESKEARWKKWKIWNLSPQTLNTNHAVVKVVHQYRRGLAYNWPPRAQALHYPYLSLLSQFSHKTAKSGDWEMQSYKLLQLGSGCASSHYITLHYITLSAFQTPPTPKVTGGASTITCYMKYSPTGPARRLATQQVGYDQKGKSAISQYHFLDGATWV